MPTSDIRIEWVLRGDALVPVSSFGSVPRGRRPEVRCPECREVVTLKLGPVRRHHAAHRSGSTCGAATNPETALHFNTKCHIASELRRAAGTLDGLRIRRRCLADSIPVDPETSPRATRADGQCREVDDMTWIPTWDDVRIEFGVPGERTYRRPDIVLFDREKPVAAIEVVVSHRVDDEKAGMLASIGMPWIEVRATEASYQQPGAWTIAEPLEPDRASFAVDWRCERHAANLEARRAAQQRRATAVAEPAVNAHTIEALRVADVYRPDGTVIRLIYRVVGVTNAGRLGRLALERLGKTLSVQLPLSGESADDFRARVSAAINRDYERDLAGARRGATFVDSPMRWIRGAAAAMGANVRRFPQRYRFGPDKGWEMRPELRETRWPVAPGAESFRESVEIALRGTKRGPQIGLRPRDE